MECKHYPFHILDKYFALGKRLPSMRGRFKSADNDPTHRHVDLKGNLIKAMMVMNWLNMLEVEKF
jgi:hypothetical protein